MELRFTVEGLPSTDHRPRASRRGRGIAFRRSPEYDAWKQRLRAAALAARPRGWRLDLRYAVECMGFMPSNAYDADNLRCLGDAAQGVLWVSDTRVRPITYDYDVDKIRPRLEVQIVAYDTKITRATRWVDLVPKIDVTIGNVPCTDRGAIVASDVDAAVRPGPKRRPRGVASARGRTEPEKEARYGQR